MEEQENTRAAPPRSLTDFELGHLEQLLSVASPPPWRAEKTPYYTTYHCSVVDANEFTVVTDEAGDGSDTTAIAALRNAAPSLISELRSARAWRKRMRAAMLDCARDIEKEYPAWARDWREMAGTAAQPPPDSSAALLEARRLLRGIRGMIAEDTTFPGAVLRVEIDAFLGERSDRERSSPPSPSAGPSETPQEGT